MLGFFNTWKIIKLSDKATSSEEIDRINQFLQDGISENMAALLQTTQYGAINIIDTYKMGY